MKYIDIMDIKSLISSGRFAVKIDMFKSILLEDTQTCEAIKLMQLPEGFSFHEKGKWWPTSIYTSKHMDHHTECVDGWQCSVCGNTVEERTAWCTCGADMRGWKK